MRLLVITAAGVSTRSLSRRSMPARMRPRISATSGAAAVSPPTMASSASLALARTACRGARRSMGALSLTARSGRRRHLRHRLVDDTEGDGACLLTHAGDDAVLAGLGEVDRDVHSEVGELLGAR